MQLWSCIWCIKKSMGISCLNAISVDSELTLNHWTPSYKWSTCAFCRSSQILFSFFFSGNGHCMGIKLPLKDLKFALRNLICAQKSWLFNVAQKYHPFSLQQVSDYWEKSDVEECLIFYVVASVFDRTTFFLWFCDVYWIMVCSLFYPT